MTTFPIKRIVIVLALLLITYLVIGTYLNYRQTSQLEPYDFDVSLLGTADVLTLVRFVENSLTQTAQVNSPLISPTLPPYDASMSPTALPAPEQLTRWAATMTAHASLTLTLPPYDASMSPTAPLPPAQLTYWAATMTAQALMRTVTPTPSPAQAEYPSCMFNWARQDLPDVTAIVQTALNDAGISYVTARAEAYGENCYRQDGSVSYFAAMTTDFYLTIPLDNLNDEALMGQVVAATYAMLSAVPTASLPARLGYLDITFTAGDQSQRFRAMFDQMRPLIEAGASGAALLAAGGDLR